ncbi:MAG: sugar phosphate nucleotidyltransferase, partial [Calditrichia bacterium]
KISDRLMELDQMVEKPSVGSSPSNLAIAGRYILTPEIFKAIEKTNPGKNNEIQLTDSLLNLLGRENIFSYTIEGKRYDIGNKLDYLKTVVEFGLKRKEFSQEFYKFLKELLEKSQSGS